MTASPWRSLVSSDGPSDDSTIREFATFAGCSEMHDASALVPPSYLSVLLARFSFEETLDRINRMQRALERLREMEKTANVVKLKAMFASGNVFVRGRSKQSNAPVVWTRTCRGAESEGSDAEFLLEYFWLLIHARQLQLYRGDDDLLVIHDDFGRRVLDFSLSMIESFAELFLDLFPVVPNEASVTFLSSRKQDLLIQTLALKDSIQLSGTRYTTFDRASVADLVTDAADVAPFMGTPDSSPFVASFDTVGDIGQVLDRTGFANMTLVDIHGSAAETVSPARRSSLTHLPSMDGSFSLDFGEQEASCGSFGIRPSHSYRKSSFVPLPVLPDQSGEMLSGGVDYWGHAPVGP